jgi:hypothetical protein
LLALEAHEIHSYPHGKIHSYPHGRRVTGGKLLISYRLLPLGLLLDLKSGLFLRNV